MNTVKNKDHIKYRAYRFSINLISFIKKVRTDRIVLILVNQLIRSGTSIGANFVEAKYASSNKDFINYNQIALKSANETQYWLCLLRDAKMTQDLVTLEYLLKESVEMTKILSTTIIKLKKND